MGVTSNANSIWRRHFSAGAAFAFNNALHFNGANSYVVGNVNSFGDTYTTRTLGSWVKWDTKATSMCVMGRSGIANRGWGIQSNSSGKIVIPQSINGTAGGGSSTMTITTGQWYYVGVLWNNAGATNADKLQLYIGTLGGALTQDTLTYYGTLAVANTSGLPMRFGALTAGTSWFDGWTDNSAMWSDKDIAHLTAHYNGGLGAAPDATNLTLDNRFDESNPSPTTVDETGTNIFTLNGFNYDALDGFGTH